MKEIMKEAIIIIVAQCDLPRRFIHKRSMEFVGIHQRGSKSSRTTVTVRIAT